MVIGASDRLRMMKKIFIFAYNEEGNKAVGASYRGYFDGEFHPKEGFCKSIDDLKKYDFIDTFSMDGLVTHYPKMYIGDVLQVMIEAYVLAYGDVVQESLF